jgi:hypothetical protein
MGNHNNRVAEVEVEAATESMYMQESVVLSAEGHDVPGLAGYHN